MERQLASCKRHRRHARREGVRNCKSNGTSRVRVKGRVVCWAARRAGRQRCAGARVAHRRIVHARAQQRTEPKIADGRACRSAAYIRAWAEKAQAVLGFTRSVQLLGGGKRGATGNIKKSAQKTERGQSSAKSFTERSFALNDASIFDVLQSLPCGVEELRDACVKAGINPRPRVQGQRKFLSNDAMRVALCVARGHSREEALLAIGKPRAQLRAQLEGPDGLAMIASTQQSLLWQWCVWVEVLGAGQSSCVAIRATSMEALRKLLADAMRHPTAAIQAACLTPDVCMKAAWVAAADGRLEASVARVEAGRKARGCVERARFRSGAAPAELVDEERDSRFVARLKRRLAAGLYDDHTAAALARRLPDVNAAARQGLLHRRRNRDVEAGVPEQDAQVACDISDANSVELMLVEDVAAENDNLGQAVRDALFKSAMEFAMCCQAADLPVSSALFAAIDADPAVRQSLRAAGQSFDDRIRAVVRRELHLGVQGLAFAKSFWNPQDEFCKLTIQEACRRATGKRCATAGCKSGCSCGKDGCVAPATSIKAIRWLRKYFPEELQVAARASLKQDEDVWESWEAQLTALETEGVRVVRSACCSAPFETCDAVRSDGLTNTWLPPVLPVFPVADAGDMGQRRIAFMDSYTDCSPQEVHGSAIMYLPSDFLCFACQGALFDLNVDGLSQTATAEWCRKMGVRVMALEHAAMHAFLKVEQTRLQRRRKAMQIASTSAASGFDEFEQCLQHDMFAQSSIVAMMCSQFMKALPPGEFWDGPGLNQLHCVRCCFGLEQRFVGQPEELWFSVAVPTCEQPGRWSDYTGRYGFCCPKLWLLRAWSMARGGVAQLNDAELAQLQAAEAQHDAAYVQVKTCPTLSSSYFICRAAYAIKPSGQPSAEIWMEMCRRCPGQIMNAAACIVTEQRKAGVQWQDGRWEVKSLTVLQRTREADWPLSRADLKVVEDTVAFFEQEQRAPQRNMLGQRCDWSSNERRAEDALAARMHCLAARVAKQVVQTWRQRDAAAWLALADSPASVLSGQSCHGPRWKARQVAELAVVHDGYATVVADAISDGEPSEPCADDDVESDCEREACNVVEMSGTQCAGGMDVSDEEQAGEQHGGRHSEEQEIEDTVKMIFESMDAESIESMSIKDMIQQVARIAKIEPRRARNKKWQMQVRVSAQKHLASLMAGSVVLQVPGKCDLGPEALRRCVADVLRKHDLRRNYFVRSCKQDLAELHSVSLDELMLAAPQLDAVILSVWFESYDATWPLFLFDDHEDADNCRARVWVADRTQPVFAQCCLSALSGSDYCKKHGQANGVRTHGTWTPADQEGTTPAAKLAEGVREAKHRVVRAETEPDATATARGLNAPQKRSERAAAVAGFKKKQPIVKQPAYCPALGRQLRKFDSAALALPPAPCLLCSANFANWECLMQHVHQQHAEPLGLQVSPSRTESEYRKTVLHLQGSFEGVLAVTPQQLRLAIGNFPEALLTGQSQWPECQELAEQGEQTEKPWWPQAHAPTAAGPANEPMPPVDSVDYAALGGMDSARRASVRHRRACVVCARLAWHTEHEEVFFWKQHGDSPVQSFISDCAGIACVQDEGEAQEANPDGVANKGRTARQRAQKLLCPKRYHDRWQFTVPADADQAAREGGIPLAELEASAVRDPGADGKLWLLHRRAFRVAMRKNAAGNDEEVADVDQKVPVCGECRCALQGQKPKMPKCAIANDFWMGKMPAVLSNLSAGAWMLLPLARALIRRYNCLNDSGKWMPFEQRIKGFLGNVVAFPQADGGAVLTSLPPTAASMLDSLVIAFTGTVEDLKRARMQEFGVDVENFRAAYEFLRDHNAAYAQVRWDENAARGLEVADTLGLPAVFGACVQLQEPGSAQKPTRQEGPAEAVEGADEADAEAVVEHNEYNVGVGDEDVKIDTDKQFLKVEVALRKLELQQAQTRLHEEQMRASDLAFKDYQSIAGRAAIEDEQRKLQAALLQCNVDKMRRELEAAEQARRGSRCRRHRSRSSVLMETAASTSSLAQAASR